MNIQRNELDHATTEEQDSSETQHRDQVRSGES